MSSNYHLLCMNHDPALVIDVDSQSIDITSGLVESMRQGALVPGHGHDYLLVHKDCRLMIGRYSYPLIELGCLEGMGHGHSGIRWIDADVIRLLAYIEWSDDTYDLTRPFKRCFPKEVIDRLRHEVPRRES